MIEVGIGKCTGSPSATLEEEVEFQERVKLFCCQGLGGLLLFMSATMEAWVRGKALLSRP